VRSMIRQTETLPAAADALFEMYITPSGHAAITGMPAAIGEKPGSEFQAFDGQLTGTILEVVSPTLIVQSWRSTQFKPDDPDSTLILSFTPDGTGGRIDLIHLDVPDHDFQGVTEGWPKYYWAPWRAYLESRS